VLVVAAGLCAATSAVLGQSTETTLQAMTVTIPFFVTDQQGSPVRGIVPSDLSIREDKEAQAVVGLRGPTELPLRLAVVIQDSGSMRHNSLLQPTLTALPAFLRSVMVGDKDRAFFESFSNRVHASNWMDVAAGSRVSFKLHPRGMSALYDAIKSACTEMDADSTWPARRILLVIADGRDNASRVSDYAAKAAILRSHSALFVLLIGPQVGVWTGLPDYSTREFLKDVADESGGGFVANPQGGAPPGWAPPARLTEDQNSDTNPQVALARTEQWVNGMYAVVFVPTPSKRTKPHHSLEIELVPKSRGWLIHSPKGYDDY
jgi:hypothetical protein